jgi:hypothetical protein
MKIKELVSELAKEEGKKHQASVGDVRELVGLLSDLMYRHPRPEELAGNLYANGRRRHLRNQKKRGGK